MFPYVLLISLTAGVLSQAIKLLLKLFKQHKLDWHHLDAYGGMPSSHAAFLLSLCTAVALTEGILSPLFGVSFVITAIILRDAYGLRMILEEQGKIVAKLMKISPEKATFAKHNGEIGHRVGHTIPEIIVGSLLGIAVSLIGYYFVY